MKTAPVYHASRTLALAAAALALGAACQTSSPDLPPELRAMRRVMRSAVPPETFALTIYQDEREQWVVVHGNRVQPNQRMQASFVSPPGLMLPMIAGEASGGPVTLMVDPTAPRSWTVLNRRRLLDLQPISPPPLLQDPVQVVDTRPGVLTVAPRLRVDRVDVEAVLLYARGGEGTLWPLCRHAAAQDAAAVLGFDFLRAFSWVQWDFESRLLLAETTAVYEPRAERVVAQLPLEQGAEGLTVRALINGEAKLVLLDLAGDYEMALENPPMELIRQLTLDDVVIRDVRALPARDLGLGRPDIPRVGLRLLSRFRVTLDFHRNVVFLELPFGRGDEEEAPEAGEEDAAPGAALGSPAWMEWIEQTARTRDTDGRGPDISSVEWMRAAGRALGVYDAEDHGPDAGSAEWRHAIHRQATLRL